MITTPAPKVNTAVAAAGAGKTGYDALNNSKFAPVDKGMGEQSEVSGQGGGAGGVSGSTPMSQIALGGVNTNLITSHTAQVRSSLKDIEASKSPAKISQHIGTINSHLNAIQAHVNESAGKASSKGNTKPSYTRLAPKSVKANSESDEGDMSHYDPTGGTGHRI